MTRLPAGLRTPLLLVGLVLVHLFFREKIEDLRLRGLAMVLEPVAGLGSDPDEASPLPSGVRSRIAAVVEAPPGEGGVAFSIVEADLTRRLLLIGGGRRQGVRVGALVVEDGACLGCVDAVTADLARVRLLGARGLSLPVEVVPEGRGLPGGLTGIAGILEGTGEAAVLGSAFLPDAVRPGDGVRVIADGGSGALPVGVLEGGSLRPRIALAAGAPARGTVRVLGAAAAARTEDLFGVRRGKVTLAPLSRGARALVLVEAGEPALPGTAVIAGGRLLGVVRRAAGPALSVIRTTDADFRARALLVPLDGAAAFPVVLAGDGGGLHLPEAPALPAGPCVIVTAGGQDLLPAGLLLATGAVEGGRLHLDPAPEWPRSVDLPVFLHSEQRRSLLGEVR